MSDQVTPPEPAPLDTDELVKLLADLDQRVGRLKQWQSQQDHLVDELNQRAARLDHQQTALAQLHEQISHQRHELDEHEARLASVGQRLSEKEAALEDARQRLDRQKENGTRQQTALASQQCQLDQQHQQLEAHSAQLAARTERLAAGEQSLDCRQRELDQQQTELQRQLPQLEQQREAMAGQEKQLAQLGRRLESGQAALHEQLQVLANQREQLEQDQQNHQRAVAGDRDELARRQAELEQQEQQLAARQTQCAKTLAAVQARTTATSNFGGQPHGKAGRQADRIARRQGRLKRYRKLVGDQRRSLAAHQRAIRSSQQQYRGLLQQRQTLLEVEQFLESSEQEMIRRWASHRAAHLVLSAMLFLMVAGLASYHLGRILSRPVWRGTVVLAAHGQAATEPSWVNDERQLLLSDAVLTEALSQLHQRAVNRFADVAALRGALTGALTVAAGAPGRLQVQWQQQLKASEADQVSLVLEALGRARIGYQMVQDHLAGRTEATLTIARSASTDPEPISDRHLELAGAVFGGILATGLFLILLVRYRLTASQQTLHGSHRDQAVASLKTAESWPAPSAP